MRKFWTGLVAMVTLAASAQAGPAVRDGHVEARLLVDAEAIAPGVPFHAAIELAHDPHWHTYWINPGTGYATELKWELPEGFTTGGIQWPTPEVLWVGNDVAGYGYEGTAWLLVEITPPASLAPGAEVTLRVQVEYLMCRVECIPGEVRLEHTVRAGDSALPATDSAFWARVRATQPKEVPEVAVQPERSASAARLRVTLPEGIPSEGLYFFSESELVDYRHPQAIRRSADGRDVVISLPLAAGEAFGERLRGVLLAPGGWQGGPHTGMIVDEAWRQITDAEALAGGEQPAGAGPALTGFGLLLALAGAFVGGLILNLMPCVFPVLGIKVMGFIDQAGSDRRKAFGHGLLFALGVLVSFWVLAGVLLILRAGGADTAWGFQLQNAGFVYGLAVFFMLLALSFSGVFELGGQLIGVGSGAMARGGAGSSFLSGVLATVVATPCSAPFLGTALGVALAVPPGVSFIFFTSIALGLASPYVVLTAWPALMRLLPRPGAWMETFRQALAFPLYATVGWLAWVLAALVDGTELLGLLVSLSLVALAGWIYGRWAGLDRRPRVRRTAHVAAALVLIGTLVTVWPREAGAVGEGEIPEVTWEPWSEAAVAAARAAGRPVYIDFTARWCFTCQTNKAVVFRSAEVHRQFHELGVVALQADWTRRDAVIAAALERYGRAAVPTNVVYLPGRDEPQILPELLTPGIVLDALKR